MPRQQHVRGQRLSCGGTRRRCKRYLGLRQEHHTAANRDHLALLDVELHPGLIVLREGGLSREEQRMRLETALDCLQSQPDPAAYMVNRVVEVVAIGEVVVREMPPL
jgi:hypothetical protein